MSLWGYLLAIQAITFGVYWLDKRAARRGGGRIPEYILLLAGFAGGTCAAILAQRLLRHKTRKASFQIKFWGLTIIQLMLLILQPAEVTRLLAMIAG